MDWNPETLQFLSQSFGDTLSPQTELRRRAEENLSDAADTPNYGLSVLRLVAEPSVDEQIRQSAAVNFKKHLKNRWVPSSATPIPDGEKKQIKDEIVRAMILATGKFQAELSEAIAVIGNSDFPKFWPALLPDLKSRLETAINENDFASANGILATVNSLFERFRCERSRLYKRSRYEFESNPILLDLKYCSENFAAPLKSTFESISRKIKAVGCVATLRELLEARRLCCMIFYTLTFLGVPEEFEDKEDEWMNEFKSYLTERYPAIEDGDCLSLVDEVRAAVCEIISHYMEKREELLQKHLSDFVEAVWSLVVAASASERLTVSGLKFFSGFSTHGLFVGDEILQRIVIPNVMLRVEDEELFEKNYLEFIRRDMERNDLNIRRRIACELLKGSKYREKIRAQIQHCLSVFAENPGANWKYKECAIYLVVSLATGGGASSISTDDLVDVESFFRSVIAPELQQQEDVNAFPMLKASALKFFTVFRFLIPKDAAMPVVGDLVRYVGSDVKVVHSYAAICIEKLLLVKDKVQIINGDGGVQLQARYTSMDTHPFEKDLINNLVDALDKAPYIQDNHYIMRCIMRVVEIADIRLLSSCLIGLIKDLQRVIYRRNPKKIPEYYHFLFEAVAGVVRRACESEKEKEHGGYVARIQRCILHGGFIEMLGEDFHAPRLSPYVIQVLAQLVELNKHPDPGVLMSIVDEFCLDHDFHYWERSAANVPALFRLLQAFLQQAPNPNELLLNREGGLRHVVVGLINKLVSSPTTQEEGFHLLNTVIETYEYGVIAEYMDQIWVSLLARLQQNNSSKTPSPRLVRCVIVFMSLFLVKHGVQTLVDLVGVNLFHDVILPEFWIPNLNKNISTITGGYNKYTTEVKVCAVASTKLLCESVLLLDPATEELWGKLLDATVTLLTQRLEEEERERVVEEDEEPDLTGYRLRNAVGKKQEEDWDPLEEEIRDPKHFLVTFPAKVSDEFRGKFPEFSMVYLSLPNQAALVKLCTSYNVDIV